MSKYLWGLFTGAYIAFLGFFFIAIYNSWFYYYIAAVSSGFLLFCLAFRKELKTPPVKEQDKGEPHGLESEDFKL